MRLLILGPTTGLYSMKLVSVLVLLLTGCISIDTSSFVHKSDFDATVEKLINNDKIFAEKITEMESKKKEK